MLADLQAVADGLANSNVATPEAATEPLRIDAAGNEISSPAPELNIAPSSDFLSNNTSEGSAKYSQMLEDALAETGESTANPATVAAPIVPTEPEINGVPEINYAPAANEELLPPPPAPPVDLNSTMLPPAAPLQ